MDELFLVDFLRVEEFGQRLLQVGHGRGVLERVFVLLVRRLLLQGADELAEAAEADVAGAAAARDERIVGHALGGQSAQHLEQDGVRDDGREGFVVALVVLGRRRRHHRGLLLLLEDGRGQVAPVPVEPRPGGVRHGRRQLAFLVAGQLAKVERRQPRRTSCWRSLKIIVRNLLLPLRHNFYRV